MEGDRNRLDASEREQLELQAYRAIAGGEYVRSRILHGLSLGHPSVESTAYLIKSRVKRADSLVLKVLDRRQKDPTYTPGHARDIVGVRLLTLFRNELPVLVRRFLEYVLSNQRGSSGVFAGGSLQDTIEEIKVYGLDSHTDPNMDLCVREFVDYGFPIASSDGDASEDSIARVVVDRKESQYSSIHLVLWANGPSGHEADLVPVEVQLRTSLEDVWGEIDHRALYKAKQVQKSGEPRRSKSKELDGLRRRIRNLKSLLDACSSTADDIELDLSDEVDGDIVSSYKSDTSLGIKKLTDLPFSAPLDQARDEAIAALTAFYDLVREYRSGDSDATVDRWFSLLARGTELLEQIGSALDENRGSDSDAKFHIKMELALTYYWQAILFKHWPRPPSRRRGLTDGWHQAIRKSTGIYVGLVSSGEFVNRAALFYRLGGSLAFQGSHETALLHFKSAYDLLDVDDHLEDAPHLRVRIARRYGIALWYEGSLLEQEAVELGSRGLYHLRERQFYLEAIRVTLPVLGIEFKNPEFDISARSPEEESKTTANNILFYIVAFTESGGNLDDLRSVGIDGEKIGEMLQLLSRDGIDSIAPITLADTAMKVFELIGDYPSAVQCARRVLQLGDTIDLAIPLTGFHYRKMVREAAEIIERYQRH